MGLTLLPMIWLDPADPGQRGAVFALLFTHALAATVQDVAIDAWAIAATPTGEHGRLNASMAIGKYVGRWLFGAGVLLVWASLSRPVVIGGLIGAIWVTGAMALLGRDVPPDGARLGERLRTFGVTLRAAALQWTTWAGVAVALMSGAAFEAAGAMAGPMMIAHGYAAQDVGWWRSGWVVAMVAGAAFGGRLSDRWGHGRTVGVLVVVVAAMVLGVAGAAAWGDGLAVAVSLTVLYLGIGLFIAASYALFMDLTDPRIGGTQFSAYMGATNGCEAWAGLAAGAIAGARGCPVALVAAAAVSLAALPLLAMLRVRHATPARGAVVRQRK